MSAPASWRVRHWGAPPLSAGLVLLLLLGSVGAGLRVPGLTLLERLPGVGLLDYRTLSGEAYLPLRADYVNALLGTDVASDAGSAPAPAVAADPVRALLSGPTAPRLAEPVAAGVPAVASRVLEHPFTNDDFDRAVEVRRLPFAARTNTTHASREPGEPTSCGSMGGTAWYRYTAKDDRPLVADSFGSDHAVSIAVFRGARLPDLRMETCSTSPAGDAEVTLQPKAGTTYHFQVTGIVNGGRTVFRLRGLGTMTQVSHGARSVTENNAAKQAALSHDGRFVALEEWSQIWVFDRVSGERELISRHAGGRRAYGYYPSISADGRYVSYTSWQRLVEEDRNDLDDVFVYDRATDTTVLASVSSDGRQGVNSRAYDPNGTWARLSPDGRYVAFGSPLDGLVPQDNNSISDVFVRDLRAGITTLESADEFGNPGSGASSFPIISYGGRYVVFKSDARNLAQADYSAPTPLGYPINVFRRDRLTGVTEIVSVARGGKADNNAPRSAMSSNGRIVAWASVSSHLVPGDTNGISDVFVRDMRTSTVERVSVSTRGEQQVDTGVTTGTDKFQLGAGGRYVAISGDGRYVAFDSRAGNLVARDENRATDVFLHDRVVASTIRVSVTTNGEEGDGDSYRPRMSLDGNVIAFESVAMRFTRSEPLKSDVFVHDRNGT